MTPEQAKLIGAVSADRLLELTLDLVRIASPTGDNAAVAECYADVLRGIGLEVQLERYEEYPGSPSVIARLRGASSGPTLQLDGHLDTIHTAHELPHFADGRIYGRGSTDMKASLAAVAELARLLAESRVRLRGDLLVTAHGMHEAPWAVGETVRLLIANGHVGDAVICVEGDPHVLPLMGKGLGIFEVDITREGGSVHEVAAPADLPHPILVGQRLVAEMLARNAEMAPIELPYDLGPETYFVGVFRSGDFYNRLPTHCHIVGTRRYAPWRRFSEVEAEFRDMARRVAREMGAQIAVRMWRQRDGFEVEPDTPVAQSLCRAYAAVHGRPLRLGGIKACADSSIFANEAHVPALLYGPGLAQAHADVEWVALQDIVEVTKVLLLTALEYLGGSGVGAIAIA